MLRLFAFPTIFVVLFTLGLLLIVVGLMLGRGRCVRRPMLPVAPRPAERVCPACRHVNVEAARFCGHCGHGLVVDDSSTDSRKGD
ncbi:MAG: hypothetical protein IPM18_17665 [Phycisphaerales bacterium]|nr:hypothetical protein [Phycisphaerales bacterium]